MDAASQMKYSEKNIQQTEKEMVLCVHQFSSPHAKLEPQIEWYTRKRKVSWLLFIYVCIDVISFLPNYKHKSYLCEYILWMT